MNMWIKDPSTKERSVTLTMFTLGFLVCICKLLFSGITVGSFQLSQFTGGDFAAAIGSLGAIYVARRYNNKKTDKGNSHE